MPATQPRPAPTGLEKISGGFSPLSSALHGIGKVIDAASSLVSDDDDDDEGLPRAVARKRSRS
jgi:hypothetical protein